METASRQIHLSGWLFIAAALTWFIPILWLSLTLGNYNQQINQYAQAHQGHMPPPTERALLYSTTLSYLRIPGVLSETFGVIPVALAAAGAYVITKVSRKKNGGRWIVAGFIFALGALAFWLLWTYFGMGLILGNPNYLPPLVGNPTLNSRPNGSPVLFSAGVIAGVSVLCLGIGLFRSGLLRRTGLIVACLIGLILAIQLVMRLAMPPIVPNLLLLPLGIGLAGKNRVVKQQVSMSQKQLS